MGQLVLVLVLGALFLHLLPVGLQFAVSTFGLQREWGEDMSGGPVTQPNSCFVLLVVP